MPHIHWVARPNKLEIPNDEEEVNTREIHKCDGEGHDPDRIVVPLTPKSTRKTEVLARAPPTMASRHEEDVVLRKWPLPRYCCPSCILDTKTKVGSTAVKVPVPRTNGNIDERPPYPNHTHTHHTNAMGECAIQIR